MRELHPDLAAASMDEEMQEQVGHVCVGVGVGAGGWMGG